MTYRSQAYTRYNDEVAQVEEEFEDGRITAEQRRTYLDNLYNNLMSELTEMDD